MDSSTKYNNPNPRLTANPLSKLVFWWLKPLFQYGKKHDLQVKDLHNALPDDLSDRLGDVLERNWKKEQDTARESKRAPKFFNALQDTYMWPYFYFGFWVAIITTLRVIQPLILGLLIWHFDPRSNSTITDAYVYATCLVLLLCANGLLEHHTNSKQLEFGMRVRVACSSLVYRKILKLSVTAANKTACGQILNLLSNDLVRFDILFLFIHYLWVMPFQAVATGYLIWRVIGPASLAGIFLMIIQTIPIQVYLSKWTYKYRGKVAVRTDERVRLMSEIIKGIQVIKMYTWEKPFENLVSLARKYEIDILTIVSYLRGFNYATYVFTERITLYFTVMAIVLSGNDIKADIVFSIAQFMNKFQLTLAIFCPQAIAAIAEAMVSIRRLEDFLILDENKPLMISTVQADKSTVKIKQVNASWAEKVIANTLYDLNITFEAGKLTALVGPVGAGKTSLLQLILGELTPNHGHVTVGGRVSYACQEPWLFAGTVKNNILFGQPYDDEKYRKVVKACSLLKDFIQLPQGHKTLLGEGGAGLSGGQKARINLARACYKDADIYLLDDPLSAVDTHVGRSLFDNCINGFLGEKTRILVTHQVQYLKEVDYIIMLNNGVIAKQGTYNKFSNDNFRILRTSSESDELSEKSLSIDKDTSMDISYVSNEVENETEAAPEETQELMGSGGIGKGLYWKYFRAGGSFFMLLLFLIFLILGQIGSSGSDYWVSFWTTQEELRFKHQLSTMQNNSLNYNNDNNNVTSESNITDPKIILDSLSSSNETSDASQVGFLQLNSTIFDNNKHEKVSYYQIDRDTALWIYGILITLCVIMTIARNVTFLKICMNASKNLHNLMFSCILKAPMRFFNTNSAGRILNRFSKDTGCADELLPKSMLDTIQIYAVMVGIFIQVIIVSWWTVFLIVIMGFLYWQIKNIYLSTAQDVKRLEGVTKSPVFGHVNSTLLGLTTIRSSNSQEIVRKEFDAYQDIHTSACSSIIFTSAWFGLWLDVVTISFVAIVTYSLIVFSNEDTSAGAVGLALSQILILCGMLQYGIRTTAEAITQMTSVERILQFTKLEKEGPFESEPNKKPPATWPDKGEIEFKNLYLRYSDEDGPVLKNLNVRFEPSMKVGIVGRTGAGKSSIINALFHLSKIDGDILIDGISTKTIGLHDLRGKLSIIPQEPILFSATLRDNLDPFHEHQDSVLWGALEDVELKASVTSLDHIVTHGGTNFSTGQRQLLCLARAIIRNNKILILDEATANVDPTTDTLIQKTIRLKFKDCTVLTIAHRLHTIMDSDKILVMDSGQIIEFDHPHNLLKNPSGVFTAMLNETGQSMANKLKKISEQNYSQIANSDEPINNLVNGTPKSNNANTDDPQT